MNANTHHALPLAAALAMAGTTLHAGIAVGDRMAEAIHVEDAATLSTPVVQGEHGRLYKTGAGTLTVEEDALSGSPVNIEVLAGKVVLAAGGEVPAAGVPPAAAVKAALWLDASENGTLLLSDSATPASAASATAQDVRIWNDRRDGSATSGRARPHGRAAFGANKSEATSGLPQYLVTNGLATVYFGGTSSGRFLDLYNAAGSQTTFNNNVTHVYFVYGFAANWGYLLGKRDGDTMWYNSSNRTVDNMTAINDLRTSPSFSAYQAGTFLDGRWIDWTTTRSPQGWNLIRQDFTDSRGTMNAIYATKGNNTLTGGGDFLCEALVFTNVLSETERIEVEDYLLAKWNLPRRGKAVGRNVQAYTLAGGTTLEADVPSGSTTRPVTLAGTGALVKKGAGDLAVGPSLDGDFTGTVDLQGGGIVSLGGRLPPVQGKGGESWSVAGSGDINAGSGRDTNGERMSRSSGAAKTFSKTGRGNLRVNSFATDVSRIEVSAGTLSLEAPRTDAVLVPTVADVSVAITNAGFELPGGGYNTWTAGVATNGWWMYRGATSTYFTGKDNFADWYPPEGNRVLRLNGAGDAYTKVAIPVAGTYELSFRHTARRWQADGVKWGRSNVDVVFADASQFDKNQSGEFPTVATFIAQNATYPLTTFRIKAASAGDHYLGFRVRKLSIDNYVYIDDLSMRYVADAPRTDIWEIPNGDFEQIPAGVKSYVAYTNVNVNGEGNLATGWTFSQDESATSAQVGLARYESMGHNNGAMHWSPMTVADPGCRGAAQLMLRSNLGTATTTFTPPAGRWRLQARIGRTYGKDAAAYNATAPGIAATVSVGGGAATALGTVTTPSHALHVRRWPVVFETDGSQSVTLSLCNSSATDATISDDYVLAAEDAAGASDGEELIANGGFETGGGNGGWTLGLVSSGGANANGKYHGIGRIKTPNLIYAPTGCEGEYAVRIQQDGYVSRTVSLPEAGTYRFKFMLAPRPGFDYGMNAVRAWIRQGTATNELGRAIPISNSWQEYAFAFDVATPGDYVIGVTGFGNPYCTHAGAPADQSNCDHTSCVDCFSLKRVSERRVATPAYPEKLHVSVADGAMLRLDFSGTMTVSALSLGGHGVGGGIVTAADYPAFLSGNGAIEVVPESTVVIFR